MRTKQTWFFPLIFLTFLAFSCATAPPAPPEKPQRIEKVTRLMGFQEGITYLAKDINSQFIAGNYKLLLDTFLDADSGQALTINKSAEKIMTLTLGERFTVIQMDAALENAAIDFVLSGILQYDAAVPSSDQKGYHFYVALYEMQTGIIRATSDALIEIPEYKPTSTYEDSPLFLRDDKLDELKSSVKRSPGQKMSAGYLSYLDTKKYLVAAEKAYDGGDNTKALTYYTEAEKRPNGKNMTVYSGLYNAARQLNQSDDAERYFGQLINTSIDEKKRIEIKLLFKVNSSYFIDVGDLPKHYGMWLRQISSQFQNRGECVKIIGHSSHTGKQDYNIKLSEKRAQLVQQVLSVKYPDIKKKTEIVGMGYAENIVGSGTDDARDAIDRRVEFRLEECTKPNKKSK
jgi:outer membrane protein OmpA-like peptidoglycan-associated protein